jgi:hypothetical protein
MNFVFEIKLFWFLIPYIALLLLFLIFALINIYHVFKWGGGTFTGFIATFIFLAGLILILFLTYDNLKMVDWSETIYSFKGFDTNLNLGL